MDTASPFRRTDIISMIPVYKAAQTFHLKPFIRWTPTLFQTPKKTSPKGVTPKSVLELMNLKYLTLAHVKSHLQIGWSEWEKEDVSIDHGVKMAGKSHRGKNRGRASKDNSKVVANANGVHQSNLGDKPSGVDESTSVKSEVVDTMQTTSSNQPKQAED